MNFVLHHLKTELRCDRAGIIIFLVSCLLWVLSAITILSGGSAWMAVTLPKLFFASGSVVMTGLSFYSGFRDSPLREDHFLNTRPLNRLSVFAGKSVYVFLLSVTFALAQMILSAGLGLDHPSVLHFSLMILWGQCALYLGAFVRVSVSHGVWWCVSGLLITLALYPVAFIAQKKHLYFGDPDEIVFLSTVLACTVAAFVVNVRHVKKPRWALALIVAIGSLVVFAGSLREWEFQRVASEDVFTETLKERREMKMELLPQQGRKLRIVHDFQSYVKGSPRVLHVIPRDLTITNSRGEELDLSGSRTQSDSSRYYRNDKDFVLPFIPYLDEETVHQLMRYRNRGSNSIKNTRALIVEIPESFAASNEEITISYTPHLRLEFIEKLATLPYKQGAHFKDPRFFMSLVNSSISKKSQRENQFRRSQYATHWSSEKEQDVHLVFTNPSQGEAWIDRLRPRSEIKFGGHSVATDRTFSTNKADRKKKVMMPYPEGAEMHLFQRKNLGSCAFPRMSETTTPRHLFGIIRTSPSTSNYVLRSTTESAISETPVFENNDLKGYLKKLGRLEYSEIQNNRVIQKTLADLASESSDELMDYFSSPAGSSRVRGFLMRSLITHGPDSIKTKALKLLPEEPVLLELVMKRGWGEEVRETVLLFAGTKNWSHRYEIRRALIYYNDTESLDLLLDDFENEPSLHAYTALYQSEGHRDHLLKIYKRHEEKYFDKLRRTPDADNLSQSENVFYLKTGSEKGLRLYAKILNAEKGNLGGQHGYVLNKCILYANYTHPQYSSKETRSILQLIKAVPEGQLKYDAKRQRFILPSKKKN